MISSVSSPEPTRIILVEDDDQVRNSLALLLRGRGFDVAMYSCASALLYSAALPDADCMLIDYKLARRNGLDLLRILRKRGSLTPALMITGYYSNTLQARALEAGYADVLEKPTSVDLLTNRILALAAKKDAPLS